MKVPKKIVLTASLALALLAHLCFGCHGYATRPAGDSHFGIIGRAYEWVNALPGATGKVLYQEYKGTLDETINQMLGEEASQAHQLTPLEGVKVVAAPDYGGAWGVRAISDAQGSFSGGKTIPTFGADWGLKFSKSGYQEVTLKIHQDALNYVLVVIMVKEDNLK